MFIGLIANDWHISTMLPHFQRGKPIKQSLVLLTQPLFFAITIFLFIERLTLYKTI